MQLLAECFYWVLNMSILGGITGLAVLALRKIRRLPRGLVYGLWVIPAVRFAVPVGVTSRYSVMTWIFRLTGLTGRTIPVYREPEIDFELSKMNMIGAAEQYSPVTYRTRTLELIFYGASAVWIFIAVVAAVICILLYIAAWRETKDAVRKRGAVYISERASVPAVYGVLRPRIVLPKRLANREAAYILMHERVHIRRRDNLWRCLAAAICCMHWFNPLVWICLRAFLEDMELSCDSRVLAGLSQAGQKEYALAILHGVEENKLFAAPFGGAGVRDRVTYILSWRRMTVISFCFFALFAAAVALALSTNARM